MEVTNPTAKEIRIENIHINSTHIAWGGPHTTVDVLLSIDEAHDLVEDILRILIDMGEWIA
jgi:hypothetical protein